MTIQEALETAQRIIPYSYNVPAVDAAEAKETVWKQAKAGQLVPRETINDILDTIGVWIMNWKDKRGYSEAYAAQEIKKLIEREVYNENP